MKEAMKILKIFWFPIAVVVFHFVIIMPFVYEPYILVDTPMHFLGGFAVAHAYMNLIDYFQSRNYIEKKGKGERFIFVISLVSFTAVLWEFYEFIGSALGFLMENTWRDTIKDLFVGLIGGAVRALIKNRN